MLCWCKSILAIAILIFVWLPGVTFKILITIAAALIFIITVSGGCCCKGGCSGKKMEEKKVAMKVAPPKIVAKPKAKKK